MPTALVIDLGRATMKEVFVIAAPILAIAVVISLLINIVQVLTSLQDTTISAVPRLFSVGLAVFVLMPWMWRQMYQFTIQLLSDFHPYIR
jgi:flagellar biosynthesis protein FliQ